MASSRFLELAKRTGQTAGRIVEVGYIKPTLSMAPFVGAVFGLISLKNGYKYSREKERCIPRAVVHGVLNGATGSLFAYGMTWIAIPAVVGGVTLWAIGDAQIVEGDGATTTETKNTSGFIIKNKTRKTTTTRKTTIKRTAIDGVDMNALSEEERQLIDKAFDIVEKHRQQSKDDAARDVVDWNDLSEQRQAKWDDATAREQELIDDGALTDLSQAYKEEA